MKRSVSKLLTVILIICLALAAALLCSCSDDSSSESMAGGLTASGRITVDGKAFAGAVISVNGTEVSRSNQYGIYIVRDLEAGDIVSFSADGYVMSPESYTVNRESYDYNVTAVPEKSADPDPDVPDNPDPDNPDPENPGGGDDPTEPLPVPMAAPINFGIIHKDDGICLTVAYDKTTESAVLRAEENGIETSADIIFTQPKAQLGDAEITVSYEAEAPFSGGSYSSLSIDITNYVKQGKSYRFGFVFQKSGVDPAQTALLPYSTADAELPNIENLAIDGTNVSWNSLGAGDIVYRIVIDGLFAITTQNPYADLAECPFVYPEGEHALRVIAYEGDTAVAASDPIKIIFPLE